MIKIFFPKNKKSNNKNKQKCLAKLGEKWQFLNKNKQKINLNKLSKNKKSVKK